MLAAQVAGQEAKQPRPNAPPPGWWNVTANLQVVDGPWRRLRGKGKQQAEMESSAMLFRGDEIDYNDDTGELTARGNVYFEHFERKEKIWADHLEYSVTDQTGQFYQLHGTGEPRISARPGILTSTSPFYFEGEWAERIENKYILHNGMVTDCKVPKPWWTLRGPKFDIIPGERAIAYHATFRVRKLPLFYAPAFYKSLEREPRRSGLLTPNIGNSSRRGKMVGLGYFWAINRSYDVTYLFQDFTARGYAHHVDFRGKPRQNTDFDAIFYGVQDRGLELPDGTRRKEGGVSFSMIGRSELGNGWSAHGNVNYLSSLRFRQAFTESFNEAIFSESNSVGYLTKHWSSYGFNAVFERKENFQSSLPQDSIVIRKFPEVEFFSRDRQVREDLPIWVSLESSAGLLRRSQPLFQTRQFTERMDFYPRVMTRFHWKDFHLIPSFAIRETHYGETQKDGRTIGTDYNRSAREFSLDLIPPSFERIFRRKTFLGDQLKHVIEPRASFRYVSGVQDFQRVIHFDETELLTNTKEVEISLTNRLYAKQGDTVNEVLTWQLWQRRYFDPSFGDALVDGQRNVIWSSVGLTPYTFLDGRRLTSPIVSALRASPKPGFGFEWRADYDPVRGGIVNSGFTADARWGSYFISAGHNQVHSSPVLSPNANQFRGLIGVGKPDSRGWSAAFSAIYDYRIGVMQFATTQVTYNTDCCGLSFQFRRFGIGRNENQFRVAFAVSNIGSFGTLKKQERLF